MRHLLFTFACLVAACSGEDKKVLTQPRTGGTGGDAGEGGAPARGGTGGTSGTGVTGGTGGSGNTGAGSLDPGEIYLLGMLAPMRADRFALCHWSTPEEYAAGFGDIDVYKTTIGESGLIYQPSFNRTEVRRFTPDLESDEPLESITYPTDPMDNDPVIAELECVGGSVIDFVVGFNDRIVYRCTGTGAGWYDGGDLLFTDADFLGDMLSLGENHAFFIEMTGDLGAYVVNVAGSERIHVLADVVLTDVGSVDAARAIPGGFLVKTTKDRNPDPFVADIVEELWEIGEGGDESLLGTYEPWDSPAVYTGRLDPDGTLYTLGGLDLSDETKLGRRTVGGGNEVVYSELEPANVFISGAGLVTGP